jgi:formylglycine-generating enzyme required for sulfatase activity
MGWRVPHRRKLARVAASFLTYCLVPLASNLLAAAAASADHDRVAPQPGWEEQARKLAAIEVPEGMVPVPGGAFLMGSDPHVDVDAGPQEQPQRQVQLDAFEIDRYEVSNVHYLRYVLATGAPWLPFWRGNPFTEKMARHPAIGVSWTDADAYCRWAGKRLPTEAEWEKAARGTDGRIFPWGNEPAGWQKSNIAHPGSKRGFKYPPLANVDRYDRGTSPYGAYQMAGNAAEWVADWFLTNYYRRAGDVNPTGPETGEMKVYRGGSWNEDPEVARSAGRGAKAPDERSYLIGFRCARAAQVIGYGQ